MPKNNKLSIVNQNNSDEFFQKLKTEDEECYKEFIKLIIQYRDEEINIETLINKTEELLSKYPELLEEALIFIDHKRLNIINIKKNIINKNNINNNSNNDANKKQNNKTNALDKNSTDNNQLNVKKEIRHQNIKMDLSPKKEKYQIINYYSHLSPKIQMSPDYIFFNGLKDLFPPEIYKILIKILYLYNEGIISQYEFTILITPYFTQPNHQNLLEFFKSLTNSKILNRRQHAIFDRPMCEMDFTKTRQISGYFELPKEYPILISSGRTDFENSIFNDRLITIPTGSEDDKNPMKKNHYEENLFAFEDQRYGIDMIIEVFQYAIDKLSKLKEKLNNNIIKKGELNEEILEKEIGKNVKRLIKRYYRDYGPKVIDGFINNPIQVINVVIKRFNIRIEEAKKQKQEEEKNIKSHFDRIYAKSFDYRSFKFKNFDKRNNNSKAFLREIINRNIK